LKRVGFYPGKEKIKPMLQLGNDLGCWERCIHVEVIYQKKSKYNHVDLWF
jgi:hypothetical protein